MWNGTGNTFFFLEGYLQWYGWTGGKIKTWRKFMKYLRVLNFVWQSLNLLHLSLHEGGINLQKRKFNNFIERKKKHCHFYHNFRQQIHFQLYPILSIDRISMINSIYATNSMDMPVLWFDAHKKNLCLKQIHLPITHLISGSVPYAIQWSLNFSPSTTAWLWDNCLKYTFAAM